MIQLDGTIVANLPVTASEDFAGETVVIHFDRGTYFSLRGSAGTIWSLLQEPTSVGAIVAASRAHGGALPSDFETTLASFVGKLAEHDLITSSPGPESAPLISADAVASFAEPPSLEVYTDLSELIAMDPVHEIDVFTGWPAPPREGK